MLVRKTMKKANCLRCKNSIDIKYISQSRDYSKKNNWCYWTKDEKNHKLYICNDCLIKLYQNYRNDFYQLIPNERKQGLLRRYINEGTIKKKSKKSFLPKKFYDPKKFCEDEEKGDKISENQNYKMDKKIE